MDTTTTAKFETIAVTIEEPIGIITIDRPKALNALNATCLKELDKALEMLEKDEGVKVIIITGAGEKAFVAGADITEFKDMTSQDAIAVVQRGQAIFDKIERLDKPVIAAVNGFALGGGCELAMACDIRIVSETAKFGQPEVNLGIIPGYGGTQRLSRLVGKGRASELIFTGDMIDGAEAYRIGIANKLTPPEQLLETAKKMASKIAGKGFLAVKAAKRAINRGLDMDLQNACRYEGAEFALLFSTEDKAEGISAFLEKRKAEFKGR